MVAKEYFYGLKTALDIKKRYRRLAKQMHPDIAGDQSKQQMQELRNQYAKALKNAGKSDDEISDIFSEEGIEKANDFMEKAQQHEGGIFSFMKKMSDGISEKLIAEAERTGKEPTIADGIKMAMESVFGKKNTKEIFSGDQLSLDQPHPDPDDGNNKQNEKKDHDNG